MRQTTMDIFKKMLPTLILYLALVAGFQTLIGAMGLGTSAFVEMNPQAMQAPQFNFGGAAALSGLLNLVFYIAMGLFGFGVVLSIYRIARYGSEITIADNFYFFNANFLKTAVTYVLQNLLMLLGLVFFVIPGILFSLAMVPLGAVIGIGQIQGRAGIIQPIKESWRVTRGHKGMIFGRVVLAGIGVFILVFLSIFASMAAGITGVMAAIQGILITVLSGLITYIATIDIVRELVERGAFREIERDELDGGDF